MVFLEKFLFVRRVFIRDSHWNALNKYDNLIVLGE